MKCSCDYKGPPFSGVRGQFGLHAHLIPRRLSMDCQLNLHCAKLCMHFLMQTIVCWALNQDFSTNFHLAWGHSKTRQTYMEGKCNSCSSELECIRQRNASISRAVRSDLMLTKWRLTTFYKGKFIACHCPREVILLLETNMAKVF